MAFTTKEDLIVRIEAVFPDAPFESAWHACPCGCYECVELDEAIRSKNWTQFTPIECRLVSAGACLFTDEAFAYFLPAYLRAALLDPGEADVAVEGTAWQFLPHGLGAQSRRTFFNLTQTQREVLVDWLEWWVASEEEEWSYILSDMDAANPSELHAKIVAELAQNRTGLAEWRRKLENGEG